MGLDHYISFLGRKEYIYGRHFAPTDIEVRELSTGKSRYEIAKGLGIEFEIVDKLSIDDGINAAKMMWPHLWVDEGKCQIFLDYISQYHKEWDDKRGMFKPHPCHDFTSHAGDMLRYTAIAEKKMSNDPVAAVQLTKFEQNKSRQNLNSSK
jgi:hypothetical protein